VTGELGTGVLRSLPLAFRIATLFGCRIEDVFTPDDE
jgi:DNA-binding XRE family transcriptional regulator